MTNNPNLPETVARIIDPGIFALLDEIGGIECASRVNEALSKAHQIIELVRGEEKEGGSDANAQQPTESGHGALPMPSLDAKPYPMADSDWEHVRFHAGCVTEQDDRHKVLFFDAFVPGLIREIEALRGVLVGCERYAHRALDGGPFAGSNLLALANLTRARLPSDEPREDA